MSAQSWYYSGTDRLDHRLARENRGLLTKVGAAGLLAGILLDQGIAFALKVRDGSDLGATWRHWTSLSASVTIEAATSRFFVIM